MDDLTKIVQWSLPCRSSDGPDAISQCADDSHVQGPGTWQQKSGL